MSKIIIGFLVMVVVLGLGGCSPGPEGPENNTDKSGSVNNKPDQGREQLPVARNMSAQADQFRDNSQSLQKLLDRMEEK